MTAIIQAASRLTRTDVDSEPLKAILIFSGIGLLLSLIAIQAYGFSPAKKDHYDCLSAEILQRPSKEKIHVSFEYHCGKLASAKCSSSCRDDVAAR